MRHLTTESLIGLAEGRLPTEKRQDAQRHLETCPRCFAESLEWSSLLETIRTPPLEDAPEHAIRKCLAMYSVPKPVSKLEQLFATIVFDSRLVPNPAGVRGPVADCRQILLRGPDVDVHLRIEGTPRIILGQMLQRKASHFLVDVPVCLSNAGRQIETATTDELGEFRFATAPSGALRLQADLPSYRLIGDFTVGEEM